MESNEKEFNGFEMSFSQETKLVTEKNNSW